LRLINKKPNFVLSNNKPMTTKTKTANSSNLNLAKPYQDITIEQLQAEIRKAEKGKFQTVQESMQDFDKWLTSRERK
jgi:hypothetical protein